VVAQQFLQRLQGSNAALRVLLAVTVLVAGFAAKRAVQHGLDRSLQEGLALEGALQKQLLRTDEAEEGLRAFAERRRPAYATIATPALAKMPKT
jgi:1,4-dihydroxy-2-naphthoyl-CoA synthase